MKKILFALFSLLVTSLAVSAQKQEYNLNIGQFDKIQITDNVNVEYICKPDSSGWVAFECDKAFSDAFIFTNSKGKLKIQVNSEDVDIPHLPTIRVYSDFITSVENSSDSTLTVNCGGAVPSFTARLMGNGRIVVRDLKANELSAALTTGNGDLSISGNVREANYKMVGTGTINGIAVNAETVKCNILGTGVIYCSADKKLDVRGIGSTKIYYRGKPEIKKVGGGKLFEYTNVD